MTTPLVPVFHKMDALQLPAEVRDPAFQALVEKGYSIGTVMILAEGREGEEKHTVGLIMLPPNPLRPIIEFTPTISMPVPERVLALPDVLGRWARWWTWLLVLALAACAAQLVVVVVVLVRWAS